MISNFERGRLYAKKFPPAISGERGHNRTFQLAATLVHRFDLGDGEALTILREWNATCKPPWRDRDLVHKIKSARVSKSTLTDSGRRGFKANEFAFPSSATSPKPGFNPALLQLVASKTKGIKDVVKFLQKVSPVPVEGLDAAGFLRHLYPRGGGEKVLLFTDMRSQGQFVWDARVAPDLRLPAGPDGIWFLPQPVTGKYYTNPRMEGKRSRRSEEAITSWRFLVLESDQAPKDEWLRCLIQLPFKIASICDSGGRSIHALVKVDATSKTAWEAFVGQNKPKLIALGADPSSLTAVRLSRLPQAKRGSKLQRLLYLNPQPKFPIWESDATMTELNGGGR